MKRKTKITLRATSAIIFGLAGSMIISSCGGTGETKIVNNAAVNLAFDSQKGNVTASALEGRAGDTVTLTITPNSGYQIAEVKANNEVLQGPNYSFKLVEGVNNVSVTFEAIDVKVIVTGAKNGVVGDKIQLNAIVSGDETNAVTWSVDNELFATVSETGLVELLSKGTVTVTATSKLNPAKKSSPVYIQIYSATTTTKSLEIVNLPTKTSYKVGEQASFEGIEVMGYEYAPDGAKNYTSGVAFNKSQLTFSVAEGTTLSTTGEQTVSVAAPGYQAANFTIKVGDNVVSERLYVAKYPNTTKYVLKEGTKVTLNTTGLAINKLTYTDGELTSNVAVNSTDYTLSMKNGDELKYEGTTSIYVYPTDSSVEGTSFNVICYTEDLTLRNLMQQLQTTHNYQAEVLNNVGTTRDTTGFHYLRTYTENYYDEVTYQNVSGTNGIEFNTDIEKEHIGYAKFEDGDTSGVCEYRVDEIGDIVGSVIVSTDTTNWWDFSSKLTKPFSIFNLDLLPTETLNGKYLVVNVEQVEGDDEDGTQTLLKYPLCEQFLSYCGWSGALITIMTRFVISITNDYNLSMKAYFGSYGTTEMKINALGNASVRSVERALRSGITPSYAVPQELSLAKDALLENNYSTHGYGNSTVTAYFNEKYSYKVSGKVGYCELDDGKIYKFTQNGNAFKLGEVVETDATSVPEYLESLGNVGITNSYLSYSFKNVLGTNGGNSLLHLFSKLQSYSSDSSVYFQSYSRESTDAIYTLYRESASTADAELISWFIVNFEENKPHTVESVTDCEFWAINDGRGFPVCTSNVGTTHVSWIEEGIAAANAAL